MSEKYYGLIEMSFVFGLVLAFAFWELYSLRRDRKKAPPKQPEEPKGAPPSGESDPPR